MDKIRKVTQYYPRSLMDLIFGQPKKIYVWYTVDENGKKQGPCNTYTKDGTLESSAQYKNGQMEGLYEVYWENGKLNERCHFKNNKRNGESQSFDENGRLTVKCFYRDGQLDGVYEEYFEDGTLKEKRTYKDGKLEGACEKYSPNGQLREKCTYEEDRLNGLFESYDIKGKLIKKEIYLDGFPANFSLLAKIKYLNSKSLRERLLREDAIRTAKEDGQPLSAEEVMMFRNMEEKARLKASKKLMLLKRKNVR